MAVIVCGIVLVPKLKDRVVAPANDVATWADGSNKVTAPGQRLSIWKLSLHLVAEKPLTGWGIPGFWAELRKPETAPWIDDKLVGTSGDYGGAHNDALQMMIQSGVWGLAAYVLVVFVPLGLFLRLRTKVEGDARLACELGACLVLGVIVCGLTNEMLSLKYLASFFSITVAGLAAQALVQPISSSTQASP
jgi:O-antigen ligase